MVEVRTAKQLEDLKELLTSSGDVSIAVAYVRQSALTQIEPELRQASSKGRVRFLIALDGRITEPAAAERLLDLSSDRFEVRYFDLPASERAIFHPKLYICSSAESVSFLTGSYNLTGAALDRNREHGLRVTCRNDEKPGNEALDSFDALWNDDHAKPLTREAVRTYRENYVHPTRAPKDELWADQGYWLFKCNVTRGYSFQDLLNEPNQTCYWNAVTDTPSLKCIREEIREGDGVLFYHSSTKPLVVMGTARVVREHYHGPPAYADPNSGFYNPARQPEPWPTVDIRANLEFVRPVARTEMANNTILQEMDLFRLAHQITIQPVRRHEWEEIIRLGMREQAQ